MSDSITVSWVGESEYTPLNADSVTVMWYDPNIEMPSIPMTLYLNNSINGFYPIFILEGGSPIEISLLPSINPPEQGFSLYSPTLPISLILNQNTGPVFHISVEEPKKLRLLYDEEVFYYKLSPGYVIPGYTSDGTNINIPISALPGLLSLEANAVSGDWREIFQAICLMSQFWLDERGVEGSLDTYSSFYLQNPNAKSSLFKYGIGEQNTFLEKFTVAYRSSKLKSEN